MQVVAEAAGAEGVAHAVGRDDPAQRAEQREDEAGLPDAEPVQEDPPEQSHEEERVRDVVEVPDHSPLGGGGPELGLQRPFERREAVVEVVVGEDDEAHQDEDDPTGRTTALFGFGIGQATLLSREE